MSKKLVVFSTNGGGKTIDTDATNLKDLQADFTKAGIQFSGMKIVDNLKRTLEAGDSAIGDDITHIFLMPTKTKSGADGSAMSFSEARAFIKEALAVDEEGAKAHFNAGKNYTNKSTDELRSLITAYKPAKGSASKEKAAPIKATVKLEKATPIKEEKKAETKAVAKPVTKEVAKPATKALAKKELDLSSVENIAMAIEGLKAEGFNAELVDDAIKAVLRIKTGAEEDLDQGELKKMYNDIAKDIPNIKL